MPCPLTRTPSQEVAMAETSLICQLFLSRTHHSLILKEGQLLGKMKLRVKGVCWYSSLVAKQIIFSSCRLSMVVTLWGLDSKGFLKVSCIPDCLLRRTEAWSTPGSPACHHCTHCLKCCRQLLEENTSTYR